MVCFKQHENFWVLTDLAQRLHPGFYHYLFDVKVVPDLASRRPSPELLGLHDRCP